jgi:hypothetical protein
MKRTPLNERQEEVSHGSNIIDPFDPKFDEKVNRAVEELMDGFVFRSLAVRIDNRIRKIWYQAPIQSERPSEHPSQE